MGEQIGSKQWISDSNEILSRLSSGIIETQNNFCIEVKFRSEGGNTSFSLIIGPHGARLEAGTGIKCRVSLLVDRRVAAELSDGSKTIAEAISNGDIKINGNINELVNAGDLLAGLAKALGAILSGE
ncbi:MAG: hypothetical protein M0Z96_05670 [Actinomycetota bacterium]|nr:hypothetical protein [Actinomycetota bacterium]